MRGRVGGAVRATHRHAGSIRRGHRGIATNVDQIEQYEAGTGHISTGRMWDIAAAMKVPVSFFFEGIKGQARDTGEARGEILTGDDELKLVGGVPKARRA